MSHLLDVEPEADAAAAVRQGEVLDAEPEDAPANETTLARQSTDLVSQAKALEVRDPASFERAGAFLETLKAMQRHIEEFWEADIQRAHAAWKGLTSKRAGFVDPLKEAIAVLSSRYTTFSREAKAAAEREKREREEAAKKDEQARLRREADERAAEAKRLEEAALKADTREEGQLLTQQAEDAAAQAADIRQEAATVQAPVLPLQPSVTPPKGVSVRQNWTFEVDDLAALVKAVAAGVVPLPALLPNETYLRSRAKADRDTCRIAGVRFFDAGSVAHRRPR